MAEIEKDNRGFRHAPPRTDYDNAVYYVKESSLATDAAIRLFIRGGPHTKESDLHLTIRQAWELIDDIATICMAHYQLTNDNSPEDIS